MTGAPVVLLVLAGDHAISVARKLMGKTAGFDAEPGTVRGDFGISGQFNLIHGSDSPAAAEKEIDLFFSPGEIVEFSHSDARWLETPGG
jgi:nucleoside-diphosphate kinase